MQHRQNLAELQRRLADLHPADIAHLLETLPLEDRLVVWRALTPALAGHALIEVSAGVRESLVEHTTREALVDILSGLDADDLRHLSESVPSGVVDEVSLRLGATSRDKVFTVTAPAEEWEGRLADLRDDNR